MLLMIANEASSETMFQSEVNKLTSVIMPLADAIDAIVNAGAHVHSRDQQDSLQSNAHSHARNWQVFAQHHAHDQARDKQTSL